MKIKDQYVKILKNFLYYNPNFGYDGNKTLRTNTSGVYIEAYVPEFIDLPIYTKDLEDILKFITPETEISEDVEGDIHYLVLQQDRGTIRYRLSKTEVIESQFSKPIEIDNLSLNETWFEFNLTSSDYTKLTKNAKLLGCTAIDVFSIDSETIGLKAYNLNDKKDKQYLLEIKKPHEHIENITTIMLETFELVAASDYNIMTGVLTGKSGKERRVTKVKAFCNNVEVKYLIINR